MAPPRVLQRNVRPRREYEDVSEEDFQDLEDEESIPEGDNEDAADDSDREDNSDEDIQQQISTVSFGALKKAEETLSRKRKRISDEPADQEEKLEALRKRLRQIREEKQAAAPDSNTHRRTRTTTAPVEEDDASDSDSAPSEEGAPSRTSKHAPAVQSSKHQVSRKRTVIEVPSKHLRDPRFDSVRQHNIHNNGSNNSEKAYAFLDDYARDEIAELKTAVKLSKSEDEKETLRRKINSMENRLKTKAGKEREQAVLRQHRKEEKRKVLEGKTPFYLKQRDVKERALVEKFRGMKGKERTKLVEKRKKREGQRERKRMPLDRRGAGG